MGECSKRLFCAEQQLLKSKLAKNLIFIPIEKRCDLSLLILSCKLTKNKSNVVNLINQLFNLKILRFKSQKDHKPSTKKLDRTFESPEKTS